MRMLMTQAIHLVNIIYAPPYFCLHSGNVSTHKKGIQLCVDIVLNFLNTLHQSNSFTSIHLFLLLYFVFITTSPVICGQSKMSYNQKSYCSLFSEVTESINPGKMCLGSVYGRRKRI